MTGAMSSWMRKHLRRAPEPVRVRWHALAHQCRFAARHGLGIALRWNWLKSTLWARAQLNAARYAFLSAADLPARRKSDTVFIFGSGYSLNDLSPDEWARFADYDVFGFSGFIYQQWIDVDFHLLRGWDEGPAGLDRLPRTTRDYAAQLDGNPRFNGALLLLQSDGSAIFANALVAWGLLNPRRRMARFRTARRLDDLPSERWEDGLTHSIGTLLDCINAAALLGWHRIVLVGVDLYDCRYFWGAPDATLEFDAAGRFAESPTDAPGRPWDDVHLTASGGIVERVGLWAGLLRERGIELLVYNPRSLLTTVLPVYR